MTRKQFLKKLRLLIFVYAVMYIMGVVKISSSAGGWHLNLFTYYGVVKMAILSVSFFVFVFWVTRFENYD
jgi:hypothetical protein